jgi:hypothetical protein
MTIIETWCNTCNSIVSVVIAMSGDIQLGTFIKVKLSPTDLKCSTCNNDNVELRIVGGKTVRAVIAGTVTGTVS